MNIVDVETEHFRIPLPTTLSDSTHGEMTDFGLVTVRLRDEAGDEGLGYTYTVRDIGAAAVRSVVARELAPLLRGADARAIDQLWQAMWWHLHFVGRGGIAAFAMAAVDIALWDLEARRQGRPLWRLLGGRDPCVRAYAGGIDLGLSVAELVAQTERFLSEGFRAIKIKVGRPRLGEDVERVRAVRSVVGEDFPLMVDANMRWSVAEAVRAARALADFGLIWLEEPTIPDDVEGHARVAREGGIAIASGENLHSVYEFRDLITRGGVAFPEPDAATLGGITPWLRVARLAEAHNLPVTSHGVHDVHVHLLAAVANASYLEVHGFGLDRFMAHRLELHDGEAIAPERPGHGVALDFDALRAHRVGG